MVKKYIKPTYEIWLYRKNRDSKPEGIRLLNTVTEISAIYGNVSLECKQKMFEGYSDPADIYIELKQLYLESR